MRVRQRSPSQFSGKRCKCAGEMPPWSHDSQAAHLQVWYVGGFFIYTARPTTDARAAGGVPDTHLR